MTTPVYLFDGPQEVSQGTGFFYANMKPDRPREAETVFLVTNYHVVTGHAPRTAAPRSGDRIRFALHLDREDLENTRTIELPLYDAHDEPIWASSESFPGADVVLLPLPASASPLFVFTEAHTKGDIKIRPTSGATLLGYPYGFYDTKHLLPIWKTGHVASEPDVDFEGEPTFLVDVSAFPGMSGSPVLAVANGIYETESGVMRSGRVLKLLGIFSAMPVVRQQRRRRAIRHAGIRRTRRPCNWATSGRRRSSPISPRTIGPPFTDEPAERTAGSRPDRRRVRGTAAAGGRVRAPRARQERAGDRTRPRGVPAAPQGTGARSGATARTFWQSPPSRCDGCWSSAPARAPPPSAAAARCR